MSDILKNDVDSVETQEWLDALESLIRQEGPERAQYIYERLTTKAIKSGVDVVRNAHSDYVNSIKSEDEPEYPGNWDLERRIRAIIRWNSVMIVLRGS
ncbi:MAG: pyruvate dehydrogenase (acetyl-transferring), homodimeric type, partial [Aeromonadales bacterium]|nr:pyruvate dehydrogenase (acetyl-transferring), homodimeric type [Aeromonadales bacterium]